MTRVKKNDSQIYCYFSVELTQKNDIKIWKNKKGKNKRQEGKQTAKKIKKIKLKRDNDKERPVCSGHCEKTLGLLSQRRGGRQKWRQTRQRRERVAGNEKTSRVGHFSFLKFMIILQIGDTT